MVGTDREGAADECGLRETRWARVRRGCGRRPAAAVTEGEVERGDGGAGPAGVRLDLDALRLGVLPLGGSTRPLLAAELVDLDLTPSEINALANLADGRGRTVSELGAAVGTRPTTLTSVLDRLERRGHITRGTRPGDRRAVLIELTASGRLTADTIRQAVTGLEHRALDGLPPETIAYRHTALRALTKVAS